MKTMAVIEQLHEIIKCISGENKIAYEYPTADGPPEFSIPAQLFWPMVVEQVPSLANYKPLFKYNHWHVFPKATLDDIGGKATIYYEGCYLPHPAVLIIAYELEMRKQEYLAEHRSAFEYLAKFCDELISDRYRDFPEDVVKEKNNKTSKILDRIVESSITKIVIGSSPDVEDLQSLLENGFDYSRISGLSDEYMVKYILADNLYRPAELWLKNGVEAETVTEVYNVGSCCDLYATCPTVANGQTVVVKTLSLIDKMHVQTTRRLSGGMYG